MCQHELLLFQYEWYISSERPGDARRGLYVHPPLLRQPRRRPPQRAIQQRIVPGERLEVAPDCLLIAARHGTREGVLRLLAREVLERALHERPQRLPRLRIREPGMAQQPLRDRLHDDEVDRREHGPGVVDRLLLAAEPERSHPELL